VAAKEKSKKRESALRRYWRETMGELRRVTWPTRQEATRLTVLVLIVMTLMSVFLWSIDVGAEALLALALGAR
jgi:preprotein translocase subunit SecE